MDVKRFAPLIAVGLALVVAAPAHAKVGPITSTSVTGPGFRGPRGGIDRDDAQYFAEHSGLFGDASSMTTNASLERPPIAAADLGPSYLVSFTFRDMNDRTGRLLKSHSTLREYFFPFAKGGALTYVPAGQVVAMDSGHPITLDAHWSAPSGYFLDTFNLERMGFPHNTHAAKPDTVSAPAPQQTPSRTPTWTWYAIAGLVLAIALGSLIVLLRGRPTATATITEIKREEAA